MLERWVQVTQVTKMLYGKADKNLGQAAAYISMGNSVTIGLLKKSEQESDQWQSCRECTNLYFMRVGPYKVRAVEDLATFCSFPRQ